MSTAQYDAAVSRLADAVEAGISVEMESRKSAVVALFPVVARAVAAYVLWPCLLKIGTVVAGAVVSAVLRRLGSMTLTDVAGLVNEHLRSEGLPPMATGAGYATLNRAFGSASPSAGVDLFAPTAPIDDADPLTYAPTAPVEASSNRRSFPQ